MYVREKKIRRGEKTYSYWQVVEGHRVDEKVKQRVVAHLGPHEDRDEADFHARTSGILCGVLECGEAGTIEPEVRWEYRNPVTGEVRSFPYLWCAAHYKAWQNRERFMTSPVFPWLRRSTAKSARPRS